MTKNKYYAIKKPITKIVTSWDECKTLVSGVKGVQCELLVTKVTSF